MEIFGYFITALLGLSIGSFINVLIYRLQRGESSWWGRSHCDSCKVTLAWYDIIPVVSFVLLRGKCRTCQAEIPWQYPLIELGTMILFLWGYWLIHS